MARREAEGGMTEQVAKKISSKGRSDFLIEPEDSEIEGSPESPSDSLDFSEAIDQEGESEGEYEHGKIIWERSPLEKQQGNAHQSEDLRRAQSSPDLTTRGGGETIVLEGRRLKDAKSVIKRRSTLSRRGDKEVEAKLVASFLEDFRPTTPGHSPGIGHMMRNKLISSIGKKVK